MGKKDQPNKELLARIERRLDAMNLSERKACLKAGLKVDAIRSMRRNRSVKAGTLIALARVLDCEPGHLLDAVEELSTDIDAGVKTAPAPSPLNEIVTFNGTDYVPIGVFDIRVSAGPGAINDEQPIPDSFNLYRRDWLKSITDVSPNYLALLRVSGDSMWETLHDGDQVLVNRRINNIGRPGIYVLTAPHGGELLVKRCQRSLRSKLLTIASDNEKYPPEHDVPDDAVIVHGRVVWLGRNLGG